MSVLDRIALSYLALREQDFTFTIYRKELATEEKAVHGTRYLPKDCQSESFSKEKNIRYVVSLAPQDGYEKAVIGAWVNSGLTTEVLHQALLERCKKEDLSEKTELPEKQFVRQIAFILHRHGDVREVMWLRSYALRALGRFGFLCSFALRVPPESSLPVRERLELSLTDKNGRVNADFYLDQYRKIEIFLHSFLASIQQIQLHDGTCLGLEGKLSVIPSFKLSTRTYMFGNKHDAKNQFFGLRDNSPFQLAAENSRIVFLFQASDRSMSQDLFRALRGDTYSTFPGLNKIFHKPFGKQNVSGIEIPGFSNDELQHTCQLLKQQYPHEQILPVVLVPFSKHISDEETLNYYKAKHAFLAHGLASQFVDRNRTMGDRNALKWSISNIGLALFAKMGGVPWRVKPSTEKCLIVGIGQAHRMKDEKVEKYIAYSVLTDSSGIYETIKILGSSSDKNEYLDSLKTNLKEVLLSHKSQYESFVLHVTFNMRKEDINTIRSLLDELKSGDAVGCEFVAIKFNDRNAFFGFSTEQNSRIPYEGTVAPLSKKDFLVWFSGIGIADSKTPRQPERPAHLCILYPYEPLSENVLKRLLQDAMNIAGANWRGFNAKSIPISVYYAKLIAEYYAHFRQANLPDVDMDNLPPWFL